MKKIMLVVAAMLMVLLCTMTATADHDAVADYGDGSFIERAEMAVENTAGSYEVVAYIHDCTREYVQTMSHRERIRLIDWLFRGWPR